MLKVYYLRFLKDNTTNTEYPEGIEYISHAISETTEKPDVHRVIIEENSNLAALALKVEDPTQRDIANYNALPKPRPPSRNLEVELDAIKVILADHETRLKLDVGGHIR